MKSARRPMHWRSTVTSGFSRRMNRPVQRSRPTLAARPKPRSRSWIRTVACGYSAVTAAAEPSLESLSTTTTSTGTSALANTACRHWRRRSLALWLTISAETTGFGESGIAVTVRLREANDASNRIPVTVQTGATLRLRERLVQLSENRLVRQNAILFTGGLVAGIGGFVFHAIAGRILGPSIYGQVAFLIAVYAVGTAPALILIVVLARYTATLAARGDPGVRSLLTRTIRLIAIPCLLAVLFTALFARPIAAFEHLGSTIPVLILGFSIALVWQVAIPRGILQGLQRFTALSLNLSMELVVRTILVYALLAAGYAVSGAMAAVFVGLAFAFFLGIYTLRDHFRGIGTRVRLRVMAGFSLTAAAGIIGVQILYNQDVILAEHYLSAHEGGIYGGLNKIGTILYFLTLSVSQVLFPRVVEAVAKEEHPGRILLTSAGILSVLGAGALLVFAVVPALVVNVPFGKGVVDATPYLPLFGGLVLSPSVIHPPANLSLRVAHT